MKKIAAFIFAILFFCAPLVFAEEVAPRTRVEAMFKSFMPGEMEKSVETFAKDSLIKPELVDSLKSQMKTLVTPDNPVLGFEFVQEQNIGQSVKRLTYVLKTTKEPLVWNFSFYKPGAVWRPIGASFTREF